MSIDQVRTSSQALPSLNGPVAQSLLISLRGQYDYIVIDLPAMLPVSDAAAATRLVDGVVMVVEWGRTPQHVVMESIENAGIDPQCLLGVILNKADLDTLRRYPAPVRATGAVPLIPA
jgi:polysaccharide biosynthesis transport protein